MHASGYLRDAFNRWAESGLEGDPVVVDVEARGAPWLIIKLWHCSDIMPADICRSLQMPEGTMYGQAVRSLRGSVPFPSGSVRAGRKPVDGPRRTTRMTAKRFPG